MIPGKRLTPKEKREIRENANLEKQAAKTARLLDRPEYNFIPRIQEKVPAPEKSPRAIMDPASIMSCLMNWSRLKSDTKGNWSWGQHRQWDDHEWNDEIHPKLLDFQKLTWAEIFAQRTGRKKRHKLHHEMDVCKLIPEACNRWSEIGLDEHETAFRFRLSGKRRLWGYKILAKFHLIWWDPEHKIYPMEIQ
jgi:hypothetical protein